MSGQLSRVPVTYLHPVQVKYAPLSKMEIKLVEVAMRHGAEMALKKAGRAGADISDAVKELLRTGVVQLTLHNIRSDGLRSSFRTPYVYVLAGRWLPFSRP